jgi:hypothetical protein
MRVRCGHTERGKGVQYFIDVEFVEFYERWNFTRRLRRVVLDTLLYREGFEKPASYVQRIRWEISYTVGPRTYLVHPPASNERPARRKTNVSIR